MNNQQCAPSAAKPTLTVVGCGPGGAELLTGQGRRALLEAREVFAVGRVAEDVRRLGANNITELPVGSLLKLLAERESDAVVAVSGDVGFHSLAGTLRGRLGERYDIRLICGVSSLQYLCALLGEDWQGVEAVSLHGRNTPLQGPVSYHGRVFALTGDNVGEILEELCRWGLGHIPMAAGERLSLPGERVVRGRVEELRGQAFAQPVSLFFWNDRPASPAGRLRDGDFRRGEAPMTKEAVRRLAVECLEVRCDDVVWDIGAGTGSVSVAMARAAHRGLVYAVEREAEALELIEDNRRRLGSYNLLAVPARAPEGLDRLPAPNAVFVGGGGPKVLGAAWSHALERNPAVRLCASAVTLETVHAATEAARALDLTDVQVECVAVSRARRIGGSHMMTAQNPVYLISGRGRG